MKDPRPFKALSTLLTAVFSYLPHYDPPVYSLYLSEGQNIYAGIISSDMKTKKIDNLYLMSCYSGTQYEDHSTLCDAFLFYNDINSVFGCDGKLSIDFYYCSSLVEDITYRNLINKGYIAYSFDGDNWILRAFTEDDTSGIIRFYKDDEGNFKREECGELIWQM